MFLTRSRVDQAAQRLADRIVLQRDAVGTEFGLGLRYIGALTGLAGDDAGRNTHRRGARGHGFDNDSVAADLRAVTHQKTSQYLGTSANNYVLSQCGMALGALVQRGATQCDTLVNGATIPNLSRFPHDNTHGMVKKYALTNDGARMDLDTREPA